MYKEIAPFGMVGGTSILPKKRFLFLSFLRLKMDIPLKQWRERTDCGTAAAVALVSGFSPLRGMKKIWRAQRLEQRSVRGASTQV
ncbi:hypothetical protein, partial [Paenibacillus sp. PastM-2]|uniref:hypothetical protein n=1 Tax=Paenibacillus sp. PastM-2 TaxID=2940533 RepID=UPI0024068341